VVEIVVADNGPGIPPFEYDKVVQRFYRLDQSRNTTGNGLGLSLVEAVVNMHDGTLIFSDNEPGLRVTMRFKPESWFHTF
jgi:signal transduction histidine kinase